MKLLFVSAKVENSIATLKKTGKSGKILARKATTIIDSLGSGSIRNNTNKGESYTKYGEKRIKHCRKYDLGCGYRLIILQRGKTIFIPFLGSHDECQRWLENYSRLKAFNAGKGRTIHIEEQTSSLENSMDRERKEVDEDVDGFLQNLTDKDLRIVFRGLVEGARKESR